VAIPSPKADGIPEGLTRLEKREVLHSSDRQFAVWNHYVDPAFPVEELGTMPGYIVTLRWHDQDDFRDLRLESAKDSQGWVESIGTFKTPERTVYALVSEGKWSTSDYSMHIVAYSIEKGQRGPQRVRDFFPRIPGTSEDGASIFWEHRRIRGTDVFPRPFEVRIDEKQQCVRVWVFPDAAFEYPPRPGSLDTMQAFTMKLDGDKLVCPEFSKVHGQAIKRACDFNRMSGRLPGEGTR
jgi:hypothetical protein